jgi:hypothetical protein
MVALVGHAGVVHVTYGPTVLSKPEHYDGFAHLVRVLINFWLTIAQRPSVDAMSGPDLGVAGRL